MTDVRKKATSAKSELVDRVKNSTAKQRALVVLAAIAGVGAMLLHRKRKG